MATTEHFYTGNGSTTTFAFTFPYLANTAVKVELDNVVKTENTSGQTDNDYTISNTNIVFNSAPGNGVAIHIYRTTNVDSAQAVYAAGSSIRAADLNNNQTQLLYSAQEAGGQLVKQSDLKDSIVNSAKIVDGSIVNADINASADIANSKIADGLLKSGITVNSSNIVDGSIVNTDINNSAAIAGTKISPDFGSQNIVTTGTGATGNLGVTGNITVSGTVDGRDVAADGTKLDTVETNAKDDQTAAEIRTLVESASDSNVFTDADHTKLNNIETAATADQTASEIKTLLQSDKLTISEMNTTSLDGRYFTETESDARYFRQDSSETIASGDTWSSSDAFVATTGAIDARVVDLVDDVGGFVPIANETSFPNANPDVNNGTGTLVSIKALSQNLTSNGSGQISISNGTVGNSTVTITGAANNTTYAATFGMIVETTTTLNTYTFHRLVPKATEVTTVAANATSIATAATNVADINNFADIYQIGTSAPTARADSSSLANGDLWFDSSSNKVLMIYDGSSGDGFSAATPNQSDLININIVAGQLVYTEDLGLITNAVNTGSGNNSVNTVAGSIANVNTAATNIANINTVAGNNSNITAVAGNSSNINSAVSNASNINSAVSNASNINSAVSNASNINTVAGSISNVNTVGASIADVNRYAAEYVIQGSTPSSPSAGDLWYSTSANTLYYYSGSSFVGIAPGIASVANDPSPELAAALDCNDNNLTEVGTVSGNNLQIDFGTL